MWINKWFQQSYQKFEVPIGWLQNVFFPLWTKIVTSHPNRMKKIGVDTIPLTFSLSFVLSCFGVALQNYIYNYIYMYVDGMILSTYIFFYGKHDTSIRMIFLYRYFHKWMGKNMVSQYNFLGGSMVHLAIQSCRGGAAPVSEAEWITGNPASDKKGQVWNWGYE